MRLHVVLRHPLALVIHAAEEELGVSMTLVGGPAVPTCSLGVILRDSLACEENEAEFVLGVSMAPVGAFTVPADGLSMILRHPLALVVHDTEVGRRLSGYPLIARVVWGTTVHLVTYAEPRPETSQILDPERGSVNGCRDAVGEAN